MGGRNQGGRYGEGELQLLVILWPLKKGGDISYRRVVCTAAEGGQSGNLGKRSDLLIDSGLVTVEGFWEAALETD